MKTHKHPCGCVSEVHREAWVSLCPKHEAEYQETHLRWARERVMGKPMTIPTPPKRGLLKGQP